MDVDVMELDTFEAFNLATDGSGIATFTKDGEAFRFSLPVAQLERMAAASADFLSRNQKLGEPGELLAVKATWYEVAVAQDGTVVLSLTTGDGAIRRFALDQVMTGGILETLQAVKGGLPGLPRGRAN